ncbi:MAG: UpxY family transcription antiterminator [Prevotella sp.]|jgi:transcription antitermination factor NusG
MDKFKTTETEDRKWHVLSANYKKELDVRDELRMLGYEVYVPMQYALSNHRGHKQRVLKPAVHGLVFVRATQSEIFDYKHSTRNNPYIFLRTVRVGDGYQPIIVRDEDMDNFMRITALPEIALNYYRPEELRLVKGEKVKIMDGVFKDIVGTVQQLPHKRGDYLVVEIPGVSVVAAKLKPDYVQPVGRRQEKSVNVDGDVQKLMDCAYKLLYELGDEAKHEVARSLTMAEMQTLRRALEGCKRFMPADKAAYALAHYLAAKVLGEPLDECAKALRTIAPKLRSTSMLRLRINLYLSVDFQDESASQFVAETIGKWDATKYTDSQRAFLTEQRLLKRL